jgi:predicted ATP-dependent endonuclease of OLD family
MYIASLSIRNFRNFRAVKFPFFKGINTLIGENGSGKTNVFYALRILLDDTLPRNLRFSASDFNRSLDNWRGQWIVISIEFDELIASDEAQSLSVHAVGDLNGNRGCYSLFFRPKREIMKRLFEYSNIPNKDKLGLNEIINQITIDDYESIFLGKGSGDFSDDNIYNQIVGDFENIIFPNPDELNAEILGIRLPNEISIPKEISCTFVKALRDVEADLKNYQSSPLLSLLRDKDKKIGIGDKDDILNDIRQLNKKIGNLGEIKILTSGITSSIRGAVGHTYAPNVDIRSEIPDDMERLFQSLKLWVGDPDDASYLGKLWELSLGGANLIYLSLRLLEYERAKSKQDRAAHFLFIEEPEAHIHTHIQKSLFKNIPPMKTQVIFSTHSTHISSASKIKSVNILSRNGQTAEVFYPANNLNVDKVDAIERYLDAVRSTLLFAKGVVMVEGDAEQILVPELFIKVFGVSLDEMGVSLVNIGSTGFENLATLFSDDRIRRRCAIVTDLDDLPVIENKVDQDEWKSFSNSKKAGLERQVRLQQFSKFNQWIEVFFAKNTFEVDFLRAGNQAVIQKVLPSLYSQQAAIAKSVAAITSNDISDSNLEILRLAKMEGKGWFAILLAKQITHETIIPDYILNAVAFAAPPLPIRMRAGIANFRLGKMGDQPKAIALSQEFQGVLEDPNIERVTRFVSQFCNAFPSDPLTTFFVLQP